MVSACSKLVQDVPSFMLADGSPAEVRSINKVALERASFSQEDMDAIKNAFKILYRMSLNKSQAVGKILEDSSLASNKRVGQILRFVEKSQRGLA